MKLTFFQIFNFFKNNVNEAHNIPIDVKNKIKIMATEQGLYEKVVMICLKDLKITELNKNKNEDIFKLQGQSARSQRWFDLDFDWIGENFSTCEPDLYRKIHKRHDET